MSNISRIPVAEAGSKSSKFITTASKLLSSFGFDITLNKITYGDFDSESGERAEEASAISGKAVYTSVKKGAVLNDSYAADDIKASILCMFDSNDGFEVEVSLKDNIIIHHEDYRILGLSTINSGLNTIAYNIDLGIK